MRLKPLLYVLVLFGACAIGWYLGRVSVGHVETTPRSVFDSFKHNPSEFPLINPTVTSGLDKHYIINMQPLKEALVKLSEKYPHKKYLYFAYLNNDSWIGINEREYFTAASTIKVPLAMSVMKAAEDGKISLDDTYTVQSEDLDDNFGDFYKTAEGNTYSIRELMRIMLEQSDNTASTAVFHALQEIGIDDPFSNIYTFMGWDNYPGLGEAPEYFEINLKVLSNMFLALYNAKYAEIEHSQEILQYLSNSRFNNQIVAGVPNGISVAHKIGVQLETQTYSDCGIVYVPNRHYLLCIGSEGVSEEVANKYMKEVSRVVYEYVITN